MEKRGQVSIETIFAFSFILLFFTMLFLVIAQKNLEFSRASKDLERRDLCLKISSGINAVYSKGNGNILQLDLSGHNVSFNGESQDLEIDGAYHCSIPLKQISNGASSIFSVTEKNIQMTNINNVVYINTKCFTNRVNFANDNNFNIVTNLVRDSDDQRAAIELTRSINSSINVSSYIQQNQIRIAYIDIGASAANEQLFNYMQTDYNCKLFEGNPSDPGRTFCDYYKSSNILNDENDYFWQNLSEYSIIFAEDPNDILNNVPGKIDSWIRNGGILLSTRSQTSGNSIYFFGVDWYKNSNADSNINATPAYYIAVAKGDEIYLLLGGTNNTPATWDPKASKSYVTNTSNATDYLSIGKYNNNQLDGVARWYYGSGLVYYFSTADLEEGDAYNFGSFTQRIREAIQNMIGTYYTGYLETQIINDQFINKPVENISITVEHYTDATNSINELVIFNKTLNNFTFVCTLSDSTIPDFVDNCELSNLSDLGDEVRLRAGSQINKININALAYYDFESLNICYNIK